MSHDLEYNLKYDSLPLSKRFDVKGTAGMTKHNMIRYDPSVNLIDKETGISPLILATMQGKVAVINSLIDRGALLEYKEPDKQRTALIIGSRLGQGECVKNLLLRGAEVNVVDIYEMTSLMHASKGGYLECVTHLVDREAAINQTDVNKYSALHYAAKFGHHDTAAFLILNGSATDLRDGVEGKTPLMLASQYGHKQTVEVLITKGNAQVNRRSTFDRFTALMLAAKEGHKLIVQYLISKGGDPNLVDIYGWSSLHFAASWGRRDTTQILIVEGKADVNSREKAEDGSGGITPLIIATKAEQNEVMKVLLNYGCDVNLCDIPTGLAPLSWASINGNETTIRLLLDYHASINFINPLDRTTPLMAAAKCGCKPSMVILLDHFADVNILDNESRTALQHAKENQQSDKFYSAILNASPLAKVNLIPWIEMECPHMRRHSLCGGPSVFLNSLLYTPKGLFYGLLTLPSDCDMYFIFCLVMLIAACKKSSDLHPLDRHDLILKMSQLEDMIETALKAKAFCSDSHFIDSLVLSRIPCSTLMTSDGSPPADDSLVSRYLAGSFFTGPLALYIECQQTRLLGTQQLQEQVENSFRTSLREHDPSHGSDYLLNARYCPALMFIGEGLSKAVLLVLIVWNVSSIQSADVFDPTHPGTSLLSGALMEKAITVWIVGFVVYEMGLMEEHRWAVSPSIVYNMAELEAMRRKRWHNHFNIDHWKLLDLVTLASVVVWLICKIFQDLRTDLNSIGERILATSVIPLTLGLLRYPAAFNKDLGIQIINVFLVTSSLRWYLCLFIATGFGFGTTFYSVFRSEVHSYQSPSLTLQTLFDAVVKVYDPSIFDGSSNATMGGILTVVFLIWTVIILLYCILAHIVSNYPKTYETATHQWLLYKVRIIQQFNLNLEKSPLCMLPPPLNLLSAAAYIPHVYIMWRSRLSISQHYCLSFAGTLSDRILALILIVPAAAMEYSNAVWHPNKPALPPLGRFAAGLFFPVGLMYHVGVLLLRMVCREPSVQLIVKNRLSDGRLRVSYGAARDAIEDESLANFSDERLYKNLARFGKVMDVVEEVDEKDSKKHKKLARDAVGCQRVRNGFMYQFVRKPSQHRRLATSVGKEVRILPTAIPFLQLGVLSGQTVDNIKATLPTLASDQAVRSPTAGSMTTREEVSKKVPMRVSLTGLSHPERLALHRIPTEQNVALYGDALDPTYPPNEFQPRTILAPSKPYRPQSPSAVLRSPKTYLEGLYPSSSRRTGFEAVDSHPISLYQAGFETKAEKRKFFSTSRDEFELNIPTTPKSSMSQNKISPMRGGLGEESKNHVYGAMLQTNDRILEPSISTLRSASWVELQQEGRDRWAVVQDEGDDVLRHRPTLMMMPSQDGSHRLDVQSHTSWRRGVEAAASSEMNEEEREFLRWMAFPSLYFRNNRFPTLFTEMDRKAIFKDVLPEVFSDDFSEAVRDHEKVMSGMLSRLEAMEHRMDAQYDLVMTQLTAGCCSGRGKDYK